MSNKNVRTSIAHQREEKAITLIALIITIIVILILVAVTVRTIGKSGLFDHAKDATKGWAEAEKQEQDINIDDYVDDIQRENEGIVKILGSQIGLTSKGRIVHLECLDGENIAEDKWTELVIGYEIKGINGIKQNYYSYDRQYIIDSADSVFSLEYNYSSNKIIARKMENLANIEKLYIIRWGGYS